MSKIVEIDSQILEMVLGLFERKEFSMKEIPTLSAITHAILPHLQPEEVVQDESEISPKKDND